MKKSTIFEILRKMDVRLTCFILPLFLSLLAALLEGISTALLAPLLKGIMQMDFSFTWEIPVFKVILKRFSQIFVIRNSSIFILLMAFIFVNGVLKNISEYLSSLKVAGQLRNLAHNMRRIIFNRYLSFGKLFFDRSSQGQIHNLLLGFTDFIADQLSVLHRMLNSFFMLLVYAVLMLLISWKLTSLVVICSPIFYYALKWLIERIKKGSGLYRDTHNELSKKVYNIFSCIPLVKAYSSEENEKQNFSHISESVKEAEFNIDKKQYLVHPLQEIITLIVLLLAIFLVAFMVASGEREVAVFLVYFYALRKAATQFANLNRLRTHLAAASGPFSEIVKIFDDRHKFLVEAGEKEHKGLQSGIQFNQLNFCYDEKEVLKDITFSIEKGKITAIVGPTGAGKTTLINLILRFYDCPPGSIFIDGADIREFTVESLRRQMALVSQEIFLFNDSVRNNLTYGLNGQIGDEKLIEVAKKVRLYEEIAKLPDKFDTSVGDRGVKLSGGEKQRLSLARVMLKDSEILILDEATSSLDTKTERLIQEAIKETIKGRTTIVIAHRLSTVKNADKIVVIEKGALVEQGSLEELLGKQGKFYQYWQEQKFY